MSEKKEMELTTQGTGFLLLANMNMAQVLAEELDGLDAGFERIKIPSAGSTVYEIPGDDADEPETVKEFSGVILHHHPLFAYYKEKYTGGNKPPECGSFDGITGEGIPGGHCKTCPFNQYGSGENNAKACKNRRRIYILREGEIFPLLLSLPTGSLREFTRYLKRLLSKQRRSFQVVTRFSLKKASNSKGVAYSQAQFAVDRLLTPEEQLSIEALAGQVKAYSSQVGIEYDQPADEEAAENLVIDTETGEIVEPLA